MICSQHPAITYSNLIGIRKLLEQSDLWRPDPHHGCANRLVTAIQIFVGYLADDIAVGVDEAEYADYQRGFYTEEKWFMQCALRQMHPDYKGTVNGFIEAQERSHREFIDLIDFAMVLCLAELPFDGGIE